MLLLRMQACLDKMGPIVPLKNFLNFNIFGSFAIKASLYFLNQQKILNFETLYDLFQEKRFPLRRAIYQIFTQKSIFDKATRNFFLK
jgi:hypothetical protein